MPQEKATKHERGGSKIGPRKMRLRPRDGGPGLRGKKGRSHQNELKQSLIEGKKWRNPPPSGGKDENQHVSQKKLPLDSAEERTPRRQLSSGSE